LNQAVDARSVLNRALADLVELMGLETAWISLEDPPDEGQPAGSQWVLAAHHNLPPALDPGDDDAWAGGCACRNLYNAGRMTDAYNEVHCSRLASARKDRRGLAVHASTPLRSGNRALGILNVAAQDWDSFSPQALGLLTNVGNQMGVALERAQLYDLLREQRSHEHGALLDLSKQLLSHLDLDELIRQLVKEAQKILRADACALLLPSEEPGFLEFRATSGWHQDPGANRRRVPADERSGPGLVMKTQAPLFVEDILQQDPTPWATQWLLAEGFRGHAVVPLLVNSHSIGVMVLNQRQPRAPQDDDVRILQLLANQAAIAIEKARLHQEEVRMQALERELEVGRQIQLSLLPKAPPREEGWEFASYYQAAREVGGDFYDHFELPPKPGHIGFVIADVTGKGVPAALYMARASAMLRATALGGSSPGATLEQVNRIILQDRRPELFFTALYAVLDARTGKMSYANGGHTRPLHRRAATGQCQELAAPGILLGALEDVELEQRQVRMAPGDLMVFFTDGVTEAMNASHQLFGEDRLEQVVAASAGASAQEILETIVDAVKAFTGDVAQSDDLTLLLIRRCPQPD
jgi:sigma-B regulation protein RsbU (phosphoserine phosphatase)